MRRGRLAAALTCALAAASCGGAGPPAAPPRNVVIVLVDTLRADHLGLYGYARDTSPHIDAFAREAVVFENARAQAPCTFPSVNSLLTSRDPLQFAEQGQKKLGIPEGIPSLAEILAARGYVSAAVSASTVVRATPSDTNPSGGFGRGFDVFDEVCMRRPATCVNRRALALLDETLLPSGQPFLLYLHYLDPHDPYDPPPQHRRRFVGAGGGERDFVARGDPNPIARMLYKDGPQLDLSDQDVAQLVDRYDEEIAFFDSEFGRLLTGFAERGLPDDTLLVLLSDHGEDFLEAGDVKHCRSLRDTQIRTPLVMRIPGVPGALVREAAVGNLDLVPTLLDYLEVTAEGLEGKSLRPLIRGDPPHEVTSFSSWRAQRAVVRGRYKLVHHLLLGISQLFDVVDDPGEQRDLSAEQPERAAALRREIEARVAAEEGEAAAAAGLGESAAEQLRAVGYLE